MPHETNDAVYNELRFVRTKTEIVELERKYADKKDWGACAIVADYLGNIAATLKEGTDCSERYHRYLALLLNGGKPDTAGNGG